MKNFLKIIKNNLSLIWISICYISIMLYLQLYSTLFTFSFFELTSVKGDAIWEVQELINNLIKNLNIFLTIGFLIFIIIHILNRQIIHKKNPN
ncbi:hypothetical protein ERIN107935_10020 [Erysipelothrix inopinata]